MLGGLCMQKTADSKLDSGGAPVGSGSRDIAYVAGSRPRPCRLARRLSVPCSLFITADNAPTMMPAIVTQAFLYRLNKKTAAVSHPAPAH